MQKMSEKEALQDIQFLARRYNDLDQLNYSVKQESLDMAIKALEEIQQYRAIGTVEELQKSVKEEDVLKFYYIESEDKYVVGQRVGNFYYAEFGKTGFTFYMSRYLPWGKHVVSPTTAWKEHTYPSEPKEIPFFEWLQGFIKKECGDTLDQCREAVERMKPKKPVKVHDMEDLAHTCFVECHCGAMNHTDIKHKVIYCWKCGNLLDWSE